jgi:hypothetical protein
LRSESGGRAAGSAIRKIGGKRPGGGGPGFGQGGALQITPIPGAESLPWVLFDRGTERERSSPTSGTARKKSAILPGVGRGSAMDTARGGDSGHQRRAGQDYQGLDKSPPGLLKDGPHPGTGSGVTFTAVFINEEEKKKAGINSPHLYRKCRCRSRTHFILPPAPTAFTSMDALAHAVEPTPPGSPFSRNIQPGRHPPIRKSLRRAVERGSDLTPAPTCYQRPAGIGLATPE